MPITEILLLVGFVYLLVFVLAGSTMIYLFFEKEQRIAKAVPARKILKDAQRLYNEGKWSDSVKLIETNEHIFVKKSDIAEANRILGWGYYYIGIKGSEVAKILNLLKSKAAFERALRAVPVFEKKTEMSIYNGLPLPLWILGRKKKAMKVSDIAIKIFPKEPSVWNTRCILLRWGKEFAKSVPVCSSVIQAAIEKGDYLTAGHGHQNKGDALKELGEKEAVRIEYEAAKRYYQRHEENSGKSAKPHIEGVKKKLVDLMVTID